VDTSTTLSGRALAGAAVTFAGGDTVTAPSSTGGVPSYNLTFAMAYSISALPGGMTVAQFNAQQQADVAAALSIPAARLPLTSFTLAPGSVVSSFLVLPHTGGADSTTAESAAAAFTSQVNSGRGAIYSGTVTSATINGTGSSLETLTAALAPIDLGACASFALMGGSGVSANGAQSTATTGSAGVSPATLISGNLVLDAGVFERNSGAAGNCAASMLTAYGAAAALTCTSNLTSPDLSGFTLGPGVYCTGAGFFQITASTLTLDAQGDASAVWVFQAASSLTTSTATSFILINGANPANVFWQIGSSATLAYSSSFVGTILAYASVSMGTSTTLNGRALAQAAVTMAGSDTVTMPAGSYPAYSGGSASNLPLSSSSSSSTGSAGGSTSSAATSSSSSASGSPAGSTSTPAPTPSSSSSGAAAGVRAPSSSTGHGAAAALAPNTLTLALAAILAAIAMQRGAPAG
jgi:hypothetical protein